jgi:non-ribosomal peptide synthetase component E (peptide arylation enzyme)
VEGELRLRGPQLFLGYVDPADDAGALDDEGFFRTGDLGVIGPRGHVRITGRVKDVIIRNAENISAREVEDVLATHPDVADIAVVGLPDARTGERACAVVVVRPGATVTLDDLGRHGLAHGLARFKLPEQLVLVDEIPRSGLGKVAKHDLRTALLQGR